MKTDTKTEATSGAQVTGADSLLQPLKDDLMRMAGLGRLMDIQQYSNHDICAEYREIQARLLAALLPVVQMMVAAGLLTIVVDGDEGDAAGFLHPDYSDVSCDVSGAFENGNIWLVAGHCHGFTRRSDNTPELIAARQADCEEFPH